jgi:hypothetical protein
MNLATAIALLAVALGVGWGVLYLAVRAALRGLSDAEIGRLLCQLLYHDDE